MSIVDDMKSARAINMAQGTEKSALLAKANKRVKELLDPIKYAEVKAKLERTDPKNHKKELSKKQLESAGRAQVAKFYERYGGRRE